MPKLKYNPYKDVVTLSDQLRDAIKDRYNLTQGKATLTIDDINYCLGLQDAGVTGASKLITAINQHKKVELYIE